MTKEQAGAENITYKVQIMFNWSYVRELCLHCGQAWHACARVCKRVFIQEETHLVAQKLLNLQLHLILFFFFCIASHIYKQARVHVHILLLVFFFK